jgi:hypothetical protein
MLEKVCQHCDTKFVLPRAGQKEQKRRFCGPICSRRWAANNRSDSWRQKASLAKQGGNNPMYGVNHSDVAKEKISQAGFGKIGYWSGKTMSKESNQKRSQSQSGRKMKPESVQKMIQTKIKKGIFWKSDDPFYFEFKKYRRKVYYWTSKNNLPTLENYYRRGRFDFHLDHKYSITEGFRNGVPPKIIGSIHNLQFIPYTENVSKGIKCSITLEELYALFNSGS